MIDFTWFKKKSKLEQNRLLLLVGIVIVFGTWSLMQSTPQIFEPMDIPQLSMSQQDNKNDLQSPISNFDLNSWNLPAISPKNDVAPLKKPPVIKRHPIKLITTPLPPYTPPPSPPPRTSPPARITYLGQITEKGQTQVFLKIDDDPIAMLPGRIYDGSWQLISMDAQQVRIQYVPTHQIISIPKDHE
ncbi:hypothetical protein [Aquirhabdus parva]|uniref:Uncharacterized protein n=1 Tax=Aquirhabdus parva TaxID=2283318 RepID=A0A345P2H6_9GAMM|nr:hypothetical protein [Aquirhabdus parva]AXI01485.1 hypothetical protein HYN46_00360 [Aquirhabdus parva]